MKKHKLFSNITFLLAVNFLSGAAYAYTLSDFGTSPHIKWEYKRDENAFYSGNLNLNGKTFYYNYFKPDSYQVENASVEDNTEQSLTDKLFYDISTLNVFRNTDDRGLNIKSDFIRNRFVAGDTTIYGGSIRNSEAGGILGNVTGCFIDNTLMTEYTDPEAVGAAGAAIFNDYSMKNVTGDFINNHVGSNNQASAYGGAIFNYGTILSFKGNFIHNYATGVTSSGKVGVQGGAVANINAGNISEIRGNFIGNYVYNEGEAFGYGGAIANFNGRIGLISGLFSDNYAQSFYARGGAVFNNGTVESITNSSFTDNYAKGINGAQGGAIYTKTDLTITADNYKSLFSGNYVQLNDEAKDYQAIYVDSTAAVLTLRALNKGSIVFNDAVSGAQNYGLYVTGDTSGSTTFNNHIKNANIMLSRTTLNINKAAYLNNNNALVMNSGVLNIADLGTVDLQFNNLELNGGTLNIASISVDLSAVTMGKISIKEPETEPAAVPSPYETPAGKIVIKNMLITSDSTEEQSTISFADGSYKSQVETKTTQAFSPLYEYKVVYDGNTGTFTFTRGQSHADNPNMQFQSVFALSGLDIQENIIKQVYATPSRHDRIKAHVWATPYYNSDTIEHDDFYDVDSKNYGLIVGADSQLYTNDYGWRAVYSVFGAYNSGRQEYEKISVDTTSWLIGLKAGVYYGDFYGDAVIDYAYHEGDADTAFGSDSIDAKGYGAALKVGYKYDTYSRWKADTSLMLSYQTVEGSDYTSESGATITTDDYTRISLIPQVKVGYRALKYWTPYALVRYHAILSEDGSSSAKSGALSVALPELESKDYVEYGIGVDTANSGEHSGYAHILRRSLGRSGWSATAGYRYNF